MNSLRCTNCSFLNFATASACKRCGLPFASADESPAQADWNLQPTSAPQTYPQPAADGSYFWDQPPYHPAYTIPPPPKSSGAATAIKVLVAMAVVALLAFVAIPVLLKNKKTNFNNLSWNEFRSPDGKFSISLPVDPVISKRVIPTPFGNAQAHKLEAEVSKDSGCMLMYADYPQADSEASEEDVYQMALQGASSGQKQLVIGAQKYVTLDGYKGIEAELNPTNPTLKVTGAIRMFWVSPRLYIIVAGGPNTTEFKAVQSRCMESFRLYGSL